MQTIRLTPDAAAVLGKHLIDLVSGASGSGHTLAYIELMGPDSSGFPAGSDEVDVVPALQAVTIVGSEGNGE